MPVNANMYSQTGRGSRGVTVVQHVVTRKNDPYVYLYLDLLGKWFYYNPNDPNEVLGEGAMGIVYRGYYCEDNKPIAIKRVRPQYENNLQIRERARDEASHTFRHPNLVEMLGCCEYHPMYGPIFLLSNFVEGINVDKYVLSLADMPNRVERICSVICQVLDALDYCHKSGIVHRDVKPSNIMIEEGANVRLMDLGISRKNSGNNYSMDGFIGTPEYSAPEQIRGGKENINEQTDIYATGLTFYELLDGTNPMVGPAEVDTLTNQMKMKLPSSSRIPYPLMQVIWKATEKEQTARYQTALQFRKAIVEAMQVKPTLWQKLQLWVQENFMLFIGLIVALAIIVFVIVLLTI